MGKTKNKYCKVGDRVMRGPDWQWGSQDCDDDGMETQGTAMSYAEYYGGHDWWEVKWDSGTKRTYRMDAKTQDLIVLQPEKKLNELTIPTPWGMRRVFCGCNDPGPPDVNVTVPNIEIDGVNVFDTDSSECEECNWFGWVYKDKSQEPKSEGG